MKSHLQLNSPANTATRNAVLFELMRSQMLLVWLEAIPRTELHSCLFRVAEESAALAIQSGFPLLVLPELFAEKAQAAIHKRICRRRQLGDNFWQGNDSRL